LLEWQGRDLFIQAGIPVPPGKVVHTPAQAAQAAREIGLPVVIKAQVPVGGRGKAGGVRVAAAAAEAAAIAEELLASEIKGVPVKALLVAKAVDIRSEHYLGITVDRGRRAPVLIYSPLGGVDIEQVAREHPEQVIKEWIPPLEGLRPYRLRKVFAPAPPELRRDLSAIATKLYQLFEAYECSLVEINPLAETEAGLAALDSKVIIDDDHRPAERFSGLTAAAEDPWEKEAKEAGFSFVRLSGDIGIMGNGAGLVMATLDLVSQAGGAPADFLDIGGGARADRVRKAVELLLRLEGLKVLFVNVFGGITRCDEVAKGIVDAVAEVDVPVVVRLTGTNEEEGKRILAASGLVPVGSMEEGAEKAVALAKGVR